MKKHPVLFRICLILLLFGIASVQGLKDSGGCEGTHCLEHDEEGSLKSFFSESHIEGCTLDSGGGDSLDTEGSCLKKDPVEDEDQSELSMLGEHARKEEVEESCSTSEKNTAKCAEINAERERSLDQLENSEDAQSKEEETQDDRGEDETVPSLPNAQVESPEEMERDSKPQEGQWEKVDDNPEVEKVVLLREKLEKLKPESLTDNEEDQPSDFSVTEASMGEDGEVEEEILVSSGSAEKQDSSVDNGDGGKNGSGSSGGGINKKAVCSEVNMTEPIGNVEIINATLLMKLLLGNPNITNRSSAGLCHLIFFFSPYCPFSVAGSPYVNALARAVRNIPVYGLDSIEHHSVNARYGVMGTPTLLLFHNGNGVGRYNASDFSVMQLLAFINHYTDQSITDINVTSSDFRAPLPAQIAEGRPYALWASWIFLLSCAAWLFLTSELCARLTEAVLNNWREAEAQNDQD